MSAGTYVSLAAADPFFPDVADHIDTYLAPKAIRWAAPGLLARALDPLTKQTPALELIDQLLVEVMNGTALRVILSLPPQEGKSERVTHYGALWMLLRNPDLRIAIASFEAETASRWGQAIRTDIVSNNGDEGALDLGLRVRTDSSARARWRLDLPHRGGIYSVGVGGSLTGRPVDLLLIDDPVKDRATADSPIYQQAAWDWWTNVARTRLAPRAPVIIILTRWHEKDLAGQLIAQDAEDDRLGIVGPRWRVVNIPAQAEQNDPLGRAPGDWLVSARGRTPAEWEATRRDVGPRVWASLYQGRPTPLEGNLFHRASIIANRVNPKDVPGFITVREYVDPAFSDSEDADETGRIVMARGIDGCCYVLADLSERKAYDRIPIGDSHATHGTTVVSIEQNLLGKRVLATVQATLPPHVSVVGIKAVGTKAQRAEAVANLVDNHKVKFVGEFHDLETQLVTWRVTDSDSPDRLDAFVHGVRELLIEMGGNTIDGYVTAEPEVVKREPTLAAVLLEDSRKTYAEAMAGPGWGIDTDDFFS